MTVLEIDVAGHALHLLPERALYWPAERTLMVADVHLGKGATFREAGLPIPRGASRGDLARLAALVQQHGAERLVVLGDWLHAKTGVTPALLALLAQWRRDHAALDVVVVRGNHDARAGDLPQGLRMQMQAEPFALAPGLAAWHEPPLPVAGLDPPASTPARAPASNALQSGVALAGHIHPMVRLASRLGGLRLPCFVHQTGQMLLPAFGALTGGCTLDAPWRSARVWVCAGDAVQALPSSGHEVGD